MKKIETKKEKALAKDAKILENKVKKNKKKEEKLKVQREKQKEKTKAKREKRRSLEQKQKEKIRKTKKIGSKVFPKTFVLLLITVLVGFVFVPLMGDINFGLDLQGGFEVLYQAESIDGTAMTREKINSTYRTLLNRIDSLGVSEPEIIIEGNDRIRVRLAGVQNVEEARNQLSTVATLSFRDTEDNLLMTSEVLRAGGASRTEDQMGRPAALLSISDRNEFHRVTSEISESDSPTIVIWLDFDEETDSFEEQGFFCGMPGSRCLSAATVSQAFASDVIIQGNFTIDEVNSLVALINSGSLPSRLTEISSRTVGASFGDAALTQTLIAGIIGILLIMTLLITIYKFAGFISSITIVFYTFLVFAVFWTIGGVLTLPGIAALVLGIGMAIDSNVITFARIKEELYNGFSLEEAFKRGRKASLRTILDSEFTTLLVAIVMFIFGESSVRGFSTMLIITILTTMFTMVFLTRALLGLFVKTKFFDQKLRLFIGVKSKDIPDKSKNEDVKVVPFRNTNFLKRSPIFIILSLVIVIAGIVTFIMHGFNLGIDFQAGSDISISTTETVDQEVIEAQIEELGFEVANFTQNRNETSIMVRDIITGEQEEELTAFLAYEYDASVDIAVVTNIVKEQLINNAIFSVIIAMIGIIFYIAIRFKFSYAISAVIGLVHDVAIVFALFTIFQLEMTSIFIAAVLAIIGCSLNNTIVTFDRIRENIDKDKPKTKEELKTVVNKSIRGVFARTLYTSITTIIPIVSLLVLGSSAIFNFNLAMIFGLIAGAYSSVFIATTLFILFEKRSLGKKRAKKEYVDHIKEKDIKGINC